MSTELNIYSREWVVMKTCSEASAVACARQAGRSPIKRDDGERGRRWKLGTEAIISL